MNRLEIALSYVRRGLSIIPLRPNDKTPHAFLLPDRVDANGKIVVNPKTGRMAKSWTQYQRRLPTEDEVRRWFAFDSRVGIGLVTGQLSGCIALDIDGEQGERFVAEHGGLPTETPMNRTARGRHVLLKHPGFTIHNFQHDKGLPELDMRGDGGYIAVWPTVHPSGHKYTWMIGLHVPFAPMPAWLLDILMTPTPSALPIVLSPKGDVRNSTAYGLAALRDEAHKVASTQVKGNRNNQLYRAALKMGSLIRDGRLNRYDVERTLLDAATACGLSSDDGEAQSYRTICSGIDKGMENSRETFRG